MTRATGWAEDGSGTADLPREVPTRDGTIRLGQFLKLADLVDTGADAKRVLSQGRVTVNAVPESRRGRQLVVGDLVAVDGTTCRVS